MNIDKAMMRLAGVMVLLTLCLSQIHHPYWLYATAFVGLNMIQSSFTGFCPPAMLLKKLGFKPGCAFYNEKQD